MIMSKKVSAGYEGGLPTRTMCFILARDILKVLKRVDIVKLGVSSGCKLRFQGG